MLVGGMPRTVELGRAVLQSSGAQLQLWLTTLITVSQEQEETNLNQLSRTALLELLSSGKFWVRRGNGMHLVLKLTMLGEQQHQLNIEHLASGIISAPVFCRAEVSMYAISSASLTVSQAWQQLKLLPSLHFRDVKDAHEACDQNVVRININYARVESEQPSPSRHRILADVPYADIQPPDGVPGICLDSVQFSMELLNMRDSMIRNPPKRQKHTHQQRKAVNKNTQHDEADPKLSEGAVIGPGMLTSERNGMASSRSSPIQSTTGKLSPLCNDLADKALANSDMVLSVGSLVDASIRLTIGTTSTRTFKGLDVKVNAFVTTLGRICPSLWRPAYLQVSWI